MARGWESKSVEAQIEESVSEPSRNETRTASPEELQSRNKKAGLMLSRKRVQQQLERSVNERYSEQLRRSLADLDAQIAALP
jgi:ribosomal protein L29